MPRNVLIFVPNNLEKDKVGFLEGFSKNSEDCESYFITNNLVLDNCKESIGYAAEHVNCNEFGENNVFLNTKTGRISLNTTTGINATTVIYEYVKFRSSDVELRELDAYGDRFKTLIMELRKKRHKINKKTSALKCIFILIYLLDIFFNSAKFMLTSATVQHFRASLVSFSWFLDTMNSERKITCKAGNILLSKIVDVILGGIFLFLFLQHKNEVFNSLESTTESIIKNLKEMLIYLMGSPIGLKLNHAFNHSLGKFFFYHINMWRIFLHLFFPIVRNYYKFIVFPAAFGLSFQVAMFSDLVSIATFHVYCIYVYAARLFSLQIRGLTSLWKLFIGRKYNPLRDRVDSCEYSQNQLFIGTLGFAVLLFLLPTTIMYYCVFATFRLIILGVIVLLAKTRNFLNRLPLYVIILWIFQSSSLAGSLCIGFKKTEHDNPEIYANLNTFSLPEILTKFAPDHLEKTEKYSLGTIFKSVLTGVLI